VYNTPFLTQKPSETRRHYTRVALVELYEI